MKQLAALDAKQCKHPLGIHNLHIMLFPHQTIYTSILCFMAIFPLTNLWSTAVISFKIERQMIWDENERQS